MNDDYDDFDENEEEFDDEECEETSLSSEERRELAQDFLTGLSDYEFNCTLYCSGGGGLYDASVLAVKYCVHHRDKPIAVQRNSAAILGQHRARTVNVRIKDNSKIRSAHSNRFANAIHCFGVLWVWLMVGEIAIGL